MDNGFYAIAVLGAVSLCAIVGIYYIWVRKLGQPDNTPVESTPGRQRP